MNNIKIFRHLTLGVFLLCSLGLFAQSPLYYAYGNVQSRTVLGANEYNITINNFSGGYREYPLANYERADIPLVPTDYVVWINCVRFRVLSRVSTVPFVLRVKDDLGTGGLTGTDLISYRLGIIQEARYAGYNLGAETSVVDGNAGAMAGINPYEGACMANYYKRQMKLALTAPDTLTNGRIWVGNTQNLAQERLMSGDGSITNTGILSITQAVGSFSLPAESYLSTNVTVNNFNIGNSAVAEFEPIAAHSVTGFNGGIDGRLLFVENLGGFTIMLENQHAGSVAGNRMALPGAVMLTPGSAATLIYNTFDNRWHLAGTSYLPQDLVTVTDNPRIDFTLTGQNVTADLAQNGATIGQVMTWTGVVWAPAASAGGGGSPNAVNGLTTYVVPNPGIGLGGNLDQNTTIHGKSLYSMKYDSISGLFVGVHIPMGTGSTTLSLLPNTSGGGILASKNTAGTSASNVTVKATQTSMRHVNTGVGLPGRQSESRFEDGIIKDFVTSFNGNIKKQIRIDTVGIYLDSLDIAAGGDTLMIYYNPVTREVTFGPKFNVVDKNGYYGGNLGNGGNGTIPAVTRSTLTDQLTLYRATDDAGGKVPLRIQVDAGNESDFMTFVQAGDSLLIARSDVEFAISATQALNISSANQVNLIGDSVSIQDVPNAFDNEATLVMWSPNKILTKAEGLDPDIIRQNGAVNGDVLKWNGTKWAPGADAGAGGGATDLGLANHNANTIDITSSTGADVTIPAATNTLAGLMTAAEDIKVGHITITQAVDLDAIEAASHAAVTVTDNASIDFTLTGQNISAIVVANAIDSTEISNKGISILDIGQNGATNGQILKWNGNLWLPSTDNNISDGDKGDVDVTGSTLIWTVDTGAINTIKLANNAVDSTKLAANSVQSSDIANGQVWLADLAANSVDSTKLSPNSVQSSDITNGQVWKVDLATNSVDSTKISQRSVSMRDIAPEGATSGQVMKWNGNMWIPSTDALGTIPALINTHIFVGNVANVATDVAVTGDIEITNAGVVKVNTAKQYFGIVDSYVESNGTSQNNLTMNGSRMTLIPTANHDVTGINTGTNIGRIIWITNSSATFSVTFKNANASSSAINRFDMGVDYVLGPDKSMGIYHDGTSWRLYATNASGSGVTVGDKGDIDVVGADTDWRVDTSAIDSVRLAPNSVQSSDITNGQVWKVDLAANSVDSTKISNRGISLFDIGQNGATSGQTLKWNGNMWIPSTDATGNSIYTASGNAINGGSVKVRDFEIETDSSLTYNTDGFNASILFNKIVGANGVSSNFPGYNTLLAGKIGDEQFSQLSWNGEEKTIYIEGHSVADNMHSYLSVNQSGFGLLTNDGAQNTRIDNDGLNALIITDNTTAKLGAKYAANYGTTIRANARSIPDVGNVKVLIRDSIAAHPYKSIYNASGNTINGGVATTRAFQFKTDTVLAYSGGRNSSILFNAGYDFIGGDKYDDPGEIFYVAGNPGLSAKWGYINTSAFGFIDMKCMSPIDNGRSSSGLQWNSVNSLVINATESTFIDQRASYVMNITDNSAAKLGAVYMADYGATILANARSIPDVGTIKAIYTAGTGISLTPSGNNLVIASTTGAGTTDLTFSGTSSPVALNSSTGTDVTFTAGGINSFSATGTNITITATEVDGSTSNELQTFANTSDVTSHTVTLSNVGGSVQLVEGAGITLTTTGTSGAGIVTVASTASSGFLGTNFTSGGGSGNIPATTTATQLGTFTIDQADAQLLRIGDVNNSAGGGGIKVDGAANSVTIGGNVFGAGGYYIIANGAGNYIRTPSSNLQQQGTSTTWDILSGATDGYKFTDNRATKKGVEYSVDYSAALIANNRSFADVGTVKAIYTAGTGITITPTGNFQVIANTGGITTGDKGDIDVVNTVSDWRVDTASIDSVRLAPNSVQSSDITNGAVSLIDMANMATSSLIYRKTAGTGPPEVNTLATLKTDLNLTGTNSGDVTLAGENYLSIAGQIITANPVNLSGTNATGTLAAARLGTFTGDVTSPGGSYALTVADNAVDGTDIAFGSDLLGDLPYYNGTDFVRLAGNITTTKQFLSQTGSGAVSAAPSWGSLAAVDLITTAVISEKVTSITGTTVTFTTNIPAGVHATRIEIIKNGLILESGGGNDYTVTATSPLTLTVSVAAVAADKFIYKLR